MLKLCVDINDSGLDNLSVKVNLNNGVSVSIQKIEDINVYAGLELNFYEFDNGFMSGETESIFDPIKIASLPNVINDLDEFGQLGYDEFGIYGEVPLVLEGIHSLSETLTYGVGLSYDTGQKVTEFSLSSSKPYINIEEITNENGSGFTFETYTTNADNAILDSQLFIGVRPTISIYTDSIALWLGVDIGLEGNLQYSGNNVGELSDGNSGCDHGSADLDFVVKDLGLEYEVDIKVKILLWTIFNLETNDYIDIVEGNFVDEDITEFCFA